MVMPHDLSDPGNDVVNGGKRRCPVDLGFEPLPEPFDGIILWGIWRQVFEDHPVMLREEPLDGQAPVKRGIVQDQDEQRLRTPLMELMQKRQKELRRAPWGVLPREMLGAQMQSAKQGGTLTPCGRRDFALVPLATPAALDVRLIGTMGCINKEDVYRALGLTDADGSDDFCHPGFFFSALGAVRGTVVAKRL
jgi:hypothetical protein